MKSISSLIDNFFGTPEGVPFICNKGILIIASEDSLYSLNDKQELIKKSSFCKGTIVYLRVNLDKLIGISEIPELKSRMESKISWR